MGPKRAGWGTALAVLNHLVAEGLIAAFRTSFRGSALELGVHVIVTPGEPSTKRGSINLIAQSSLNAAGSQSALDGLIKFFSCR